MNKLIAIFFSCWGLFLRYQRFGSRDLWIDETVLTRGISGSFKPFWQRLNYGCELQSFPGNFLILWLPSTIFDNKWGLAIPHIVSTILGFYVLYLICKLYFKTFLGYLVTFSIVCFNYDLIFHSFELRAYAILPTLALTSFYFAHIITKNKVSTIKKFFMGIFFIFTIMYHTYGILIVSLCFLYFMIQEKQPWKNRNFGYITSLFLIGLPIFIWYASKGMDGSPKMEVFKYISNPAVDFVGFLKGIFGNLVGYNKFYFLLLGMLSVLMFHKDSLKQLGFFLILIVLPIQLKFTADVIKEYWFIQRQFVWVMPLFAFFLGWCWDSCLRQTTN